MNNKTVIVSIVLLILVGGGIFMANQQSKNAEIAKTATMEKGETVTETPKQEAMEKIDDSKMEDKSASSRYVPYSKTAYETNENKRRVLYFYATWCPSCKQANEDFTANPHKIPEDVIVLRINYNDPDTDSQEKDLAKKYGITYQHTFVQVDTTGKELTKWNGGETDELLTNIK